MGQTETLAQKLKSWYSHLEISLQYDIYSKYMEGCPTAHISLDENVLSLNSVGHISD